MTSGDALVLFAIGAVASAVNAVAGGGSLLTYPTLTLGLGLPGKIANATSSVGLFPGALAGAIGFRGQFGRTAKYLRSLVLPSLVGSVAGSLLLLNSSNRVFDRVIPWLILTAALLLILQPSVRRWAGKHEDAAIMPAAAGWIVQLIVGVYGGYFGAGMGIMMLAAFSLYMEGTVHEINAVKNVLGLVINATCSAVFLFQGVARWHLSLVMVAGALVGGYAAARVSQRLAADPLRKAIAVFGLAMSAYYFYRAYRPA